MTYQWARDFALALIDQYSMAGTEVPATYNNQADYLLKLPRLINDAQLLCATTYHRIRAVATLEELEHEKTEGWEIYSLPEDCWKLCGGSLLRLGPEGAERYVDFRLLGETRIALRSGQGKGVVAEYFRWPRLLKKEPEDDDELDNTPAVQAALPFYAAAHLCMLDNSFAYAALLNEFDSRMNAIQPLDMTCGAVEDCYGGDGG